MMRRKTVNILIALLVILVIIFALFYLLTNNPEKIIEKKLEFDLPKSKIVNFSYNRFNGFFEAKLLLDQADINMLNRNLRRYYHNVTIDQFERIPYNNKPRWWDLDDKSIITAFGGIEMGPGFFLTNPVKKAVVIVKQPDGKYYLYLDFVISPVDVMF